MLTNDSIIELYHGSKYKGIRKFSLSQSRLDLDFGKGIYLTTKKKQAEQRAGPNGSVYVFSIDLSQFKCIEFKDEDLNYVFYLCRIGLEEIARETIDGFFEADIIVGQMLDGKVEDFKSIAEDFNSGIIQYEEFKEHIPLFDGKDQYCFKTQKAVDLLNNCLVMEYDV